MAAIDARHRRALVIAAAGGEIGRTIAEGFAASGGKVHAI
jgi:NAD(P)-dependent dehydrogenase (short-subunit alcohol dehydrogenase family)